MDITIEMVAANLSGQIAFSSYDHETFDTRMLHSKKGTNCPWGAEIPARGEAHRSDSAGHVLIF
jgi:hypothetical protein